MNNLFIVLIFCATAAFACLNRYSAAQAIQRELALIKPRLAAVESTRQSARRESADLERRTAELHRRAREVSQSLVQATAEARQLLPDPGSQFEGTWTDNRDYFYLPKSYLNTLGYGVFQNDGSLTEEAALLFGLTPAEKVSLTDCWRQVRLELEELQLQKAERIEAAQPDSDDHREISFRLPSLTNEISEVKASFEKELVTKLGPTRGGLIWNKTSQESPLNGYPMGDEDRIVTFVADRQADGSVLHRLNFTNPTHSRAYSLNIQFPLEPNQAITTQEDDGSKRIAMGVKLPLSPDSALWNYRHLFGDQPLLLPRSGKP